MAGKGELEFACDGVRSGGIWCLLACYHAFKVASGLSDLYEFSLSLVCLRIPT